MQESEMVTSDYISGDEPEQETDGYGGKDGAYKEKTTILH